MEERIAYGDTSFVRTTSVRTTFERTTSGRTTIFITIVPAFHISPPCTIELCVVPPLRPRLNYKLIVLFPGTHGGSPPYGPMHRQDPGKSIYTIRGGVPFRVISSSFGKVRMQNFLLWCIRGALFYRKSIYTIAPPGPIFWSHFLCGTGRVHRCFGPGAWTVLRQKMQNISGWALWGIAHNTVSRVAI